MSHASIPQNPPTQRVGTSPTRLIVIGAAVVLGVTALVALGGVFRSASSIAFETASHTQPVAGAQTAHLLLQFPAGDLSLSALDTSDGDLARMSFEGPAGLRPDAAYAVRGGVGELSYTSPNAYEVWERFPFLGGRRDHADIGLLLARNIPLALDIQAGASDTTLDLSDLRVTRLDLQTGASDTRVRLPQTAGSTTVVARAGVAELDIEVPAGVAADIYVNAALGNRTIDSARFESLGNGRYRSPDYATAANRVEMHLELGIGDLSVR